MAKYEGIIGVLEQERTRIDAAIEALRAMGQASSNHKQTSRRGPRKMSAAARKRIGDAQRLRWAKWKAKQKGA